MRTDFREWLPPLLLLLAVPVAALSAVVPEKLPGLVAHYEATTLHSDYDNGGKIQVWPDSSGNGHDLVHTGSGGLAVFRTRRLDGKPVVEIQKGSYDVTEPFELDDHTIFLVYRTKFVERALFSSDEQSTFGLVLHVDKTKHQLRTGGVGSVTHSYSKRADSTGEYGIAILGRDAGRLRAFADGVEVSTGNHLAATLRVGRFFGIEYSQFVDRNAEQMQVAEMLFYDRFLPDDQREAVAAHLVSRYGLADRMRSVEPLGDRLEQLRSAEGGASLWLGTDSTMLLNPPDDVAAISWTAQDRVAMPFEHKLGPSNTKIRCKRGGTLVRIHVTLGLVATEAGANLRLLILKKNGEYHGHDAISGEFGGEGEAANGSVTLETTLFLDEGDWIEVVTLGLFESGEVRLDPARSFVVAEVQ
jgi:hypothetical protein